MDKETLVYNGKNTTVHVLGFRNTQRYTALVASEDFRLVALSFHFLAKNQTGDPTTQSGIRIYVCGEDLGRVKPGAKSRMPVYRDFKKGDVIEIVVESALPPGYWLYWMGGEHDAPRTDVIDNDKRVSLQGVDVLSGQWIYEDVGDKWAIEDNHAFFEMEVVAKKKEPDNASPTLTLNTPQSQTLFENDNLSLDGTAQDVDKGDVVVVKAKIADSRVINLATKVSDGKSFDYANTFLFKQGRLWQGNEPITSVLSGVSHKIEVWAEDDKGGKSKVETRSFSTVANRPPIVTVTKTPSFTNITNSTVLEVAGTISDPDGHEVTMSVKLNNNESQELLVVGGEWSFKFAPSELTEGVNQIVIVGRDEHGMSHTKTVRINNTVYRADMSHIPMVALFDIPLEGVESDGAVMWLRRQSDNTEFNAYVATNGKADDDFVEMTKSTHTVSGTPRDQFAGQTGKKTKNVTIKVESTGNHSLLMIQGVVK